MTAVASRAGDEAARDQTLADRFLAAFPLLAIFFWLCVVYAWQAWRQGSPWLFGDELELSQLSRAIAATGHAARRGQPHAFDSLYTYFIAPAWRIHSVQSAYDAVKYLNVIAMTATAFPAYRIARLLVDRRAAFFAAAASVLIPALAYTTLIVEENIAYPYSTLCLYLIAAALLYRTRIWIGAAVVACAIAPAVRGELVVIPATFVLAVVFLVWQSAWAQDWRARWSVTDWIGAVAFVIGLVIVFSAIAGHGSYEWLLATGFSKHKMFTLGLRAGGALTIGLGVLPVVAGLATLWRAPGERFRPELRVFRCVLLAALVGFGTYTAAKAAYVSDTFATRTEERNLIYLAPLFLVATALWLTRRALHPVAVGVATLFTLYLVLTTPYEMQFRFYSDAPGFALLQELNRSTLGLTSNGAKVLLVLILVASAAILLVPRFLRRGTVAIVALVAVFVVVWNGAGELSAATSSNSFARSGLANIGSNQRWLDDNTGGAPTLYLGQQIQDPTSEWLLEFWNRSIKQVWSLDGTAPGPGPTTTPDLHATDGTLFPDPHYPYVVADPGIDVVGNVVTRHAHRAGGRFAMWTLYRVQSPLRLAGAVTGLYPDGWSGPYGTEYTRYATQGNRAGTLYVTVSRRDWGGPYRPSRVTLTMGTVIVGPDKQPHIGRATQVRVWTIRTNETKTFALKAPGPRFRVEVNVAPTFKPVEVDPSRYSDQRALGAEVTYRFSRAKPRRHT